MKKDVLASSKAAFDWIESQMLTYNRASWGIYERIRIDENERVVLVRPDTATEYMKAIFYYKKATGYCGYDDIYENLINWLIYAQDKDEAVGSFGFNFTDGIRRHRVDRTLYQNDNGKILMNLLELYEATEDVRLLDMAKKLAVFWQNQQREDGCFDNGTFNILQKFPKAPCFILWMMGAMYHAYATFKDEKYLKAGEKAFYFIKNNCLKDGRLLTSCEIEGTENWRPFSSETVIAMYCMTYAYRFYKNEDLKNLALSLGKYVDKITDKSTGAIKNCDKSTIKAADNNAEELCDLVYTDNFAIGSFVEMYEVLGEKEYLDKAEKLGDWLMEIQCKGESHLWDGGWRGAYSLKTKTWEGRCDQNNLIDEGGKYSVYAGWTTLPIIFSLLKLYLLEKK